MNIVVCVKQVPDTETRIKILEGKKEVDFSGVKFIINPYDEFAVEEALRLKEKFGGTVTILTIGPQRAEEAIRTALAMGADSAIHLCEEIRTDAIGTAKALSKILKTLQYDLILVGKQAIDDDSAQIGSALAEFLNIPNVNIVNKLELMPDKKKLKLTRQIEGGEEIIECTLPAVISAQKGLNVPRYPTLPNIMKARKKEIKKLNLQALGGMSGLEPKTYQLDLYLPPPRKAGKLVEAPTPEECAAKLVGLLHDETKIV